MRHALRVTAARFCKEQIGHRENIANMRAPARAGRFFPATRRKSCAGVPIGLSWDVRGYTVPRIRTGHCLELAAFSAERRPSGKVDFEIDTAALGIAIAAEARASRIVFLNAAITFVAPEWMRFPAMKRLAPSLV